MRIFILLILFALLCLNSCAPKEVPTTFENGIFRRDVAQVSLNASKIAKINKECERNLEEIKAVKERVVPPESSHEEETPEVAIEETH